jgi:hypothetical protein
MALAGKSLYTLFCAILIPFYWHAYGPANFLYFCDIALLATLIALWTHSRLLISMQALAILLGQTLWIFDFLARITFGKAPLGLAAYMFDPGIPPFVRALSSFHLWLPFLLIYLLWKWGYDRRALVYQTLVGWMTLLICYFALPASSNIDYVRGLGKTPQELMPPLLWLAMLIILFPTLVYFPTHLALSRLFGRGRKSL